MLTYSKYINGGAPVYCKRCSERFTGNVYRGVQGYYCSPECREWAEETTPEERARKLM